ncbi:MAG: hypothetical protein SO067_03950 [Bacilli bacterium]|nr:hypothetical protein [Bacilli bacterium]
MYLKNTSNEVKELVIKINELDRDDKLKFISYVFNLWDRDQINSLSEVNPSLLDDSIDIEIFNPSSIDYPYLVNEINERWNYNYNLYRLYPKEYKKMIRIFERLSFKEKKDVIAELFLVIEHDELLPDSIDGYEIARKILKY